MKLERERERGKREKKKKKKKKKRRMTADPGDGLLPGGLPGTVYSFRWAVIG